LALATCRLYVAFLHAMLIYLFWSQTDPTISGFTFDPEGNNLPEQLAPWSKNRDGQPIYREAGSGTMPNPVVETVERDGFYLFRIEPQ
jgi:hypothetical protein